MSAVDKAKNVTQKVVGKAEEKVGEHTDDAALTEQGRKDQSMGDARQTHEKVKDAVQE